MKKITQKSNKNIRLSNSLSLQIRKLYLSGLKLEEIREKLGILKNTWDSWYYRDTQAFRSNFTFWRREKLLSKAEENLEWFVDMPTEVEDIEDSDEEDGPRAVVVTDPRLVKIKLDATTYITDTIGKEVYSKKVIQEDPNAANKSDVDDIRQKLKSLLNSKRVKYLKTTGKDKLIKALK